MKNGNFVTYKGKEYIFYKNFDKTVTLVSIDKSDVNLGFTYTLGQLTKTLNLTEIEGAYAIRTYGIYKGYTFAVRDEENNKYHLEGGYNNDIMIRLDFEMIERGVYRKYVSKDELEKIWEEKTPLMGFKI